MVERVAYLLLVDPSLGVLPRYVQPDRCGSRSSPRNGPADRRGVPAAVIRRYRVSGEGKQLTQEAGADAPRCADPGIVELIHDGDKLRPLQRLSMRRDGGWIVKPVSTPGQDADVDAEHVQGHVLHRPPGTDRRCV